MREGRKGVGTPVWEESGRECQNDRRREVREKSFRTERGKREKEREKKKKKKRRRRANASFFTPTVMDRDRRLTGFLRGQTDSVKAPAGFELSNPWRVSITIILPGRGRTEKDESFADDCYF